MSTPTITIIGNLTADPVLRQTRNGGMCASFTIAANNARRNQQTGQMEQEGSFFVSCTAWEKDWSHIATNAANGLHKGMKVIAYGQIEQRPYTDRNGVQRQSTDMTVYEIGVAMSKYAVNIPSSQTQAATAPAAGYAQQPSQQSAQTPGADPWAGTDYGEYGNASGEPEF